MQSTILGLFLFVCFWAANASADARDVVKIVNEHCMPCHSSKGGTVCFKKLNDLKKNSGTIQYLLEKGLMPKTKSVGHFRSFNNEIYLSDKDREKLIAFLKSDETKNSSLKKFTAQKTKLKEIKFRVDVKSIANGSDNYAMIKVPFNQKKNYKIKGYNIKTGSGKEFHHIGIFVLKVDERNRYTLSSGLNSFYYTPEMDVEKKDSLDKIYELMKIVPKGTKFFWDWMIFKTEWQIGGQSYIFPENAGFILPKEGLLLLDNVHLRPTPSNKTLSVDVIFYYEEEKMEGFDYLYVVDVANTPGAILQPPLKIPANSYQRHVLSTTLPGDMKLHALSPHMHALGKRFLSFALVDRDTVPLIKIDDWDPDWMKTYTLEKPILLPKGSSIICIGEYDNTTNNPRNPTNPPRDVGNAMTFREEMLNMIVTFTSDQ